MHTALCVSDTSLLNVSAIMLMSKFSINTLVKMTQTICTRRPIEGDGDAATESTMDDTSPSDTHTMARDACFGMHACMYVCMYVCMCAYTKGALLKAMATLQPSLLWMKHRLVTPIPWPERRLYWYVCMHACMYVGMYVVMYVCMYVCMYACMYVCM